MISPGLTAELTGYLSTDSMYSASQSTNSWPNFLKTSFSMLISHDYYTFSPLLSQKRRKSVGKWHRDKDHRRAQALFISFSLSRPAWKLWAIEHGCMPLRLSTPGSEKAARFWVEERRVHQKIAILSKNTKICCVRRKNVV
jgi:hypothetical protein